MAVSAAAISDPLQAIGTDSWTLGLLADVAPSPEALPLQLPLITKEPALGQFALKRIYNTTREWRLSVGLYSGPLITEESVGTKK